MERLEDLEKYFIGNFLLILSKKEKEICKEVESKFLNNKELIKKKATCYSQFISLTKCDDKDLVKKCNDYLEMVNNFKIIESSFKKVNFEREERQSWLDMRHMSLNEI